MIERIERQIGRKLTDIEREEISKLTELQVKVIVGLVEDARHNGWDQGQRPPEWLSQVLNEGDGVYRP